MKKNLKRIIARLTRREIVAQDIRAGLKGKPFLWPDWARHLHSAVAAEMGCTVLTATALDKRGYQLAAGAVPVGKVYFGAPLKRYAHVYVLEVQATPKK